MAWAMLHDVRCHLARVAVDEGSFVPSTLKDLSCMINWWSCSDTADLQYEFVGLLE